VEYSKDPSLDAWAKGIVGQITSRPAGLITCKDCRVKELKWVQIWSTGEWVLQSQDGKRHGCALPGENVTRAFKAPAWRRGRMKRR
jgi:hypothetical protein